MQSKRSKVMKTSNLHWPLAAILCLTGCAQQQKAPSELTSTSSITDKKSSEASYLKSTSDKKGSSDLASVPVAGEKKPSSELPPAPSKSDKPVSSITNVPANIPGQNPLQSTDNSKLIIDLSKELTERKLDKVPDSLIICSVNGVPLTFGDYRREFKMEQQEVQASLTYNAKLANQLLQAAHKKGITLSKEEKATLLKSTGKMQVGGQKSFDKMLAESHLNKNDFTKQVIDMGLAYKTANILVETNLLSELINHSFLTQAAKDNGFSKDAIQKYTEITHSPNYKKMLATGAFTADDLRNEIIGNELCSKEIEKIAKDSPLTDSELNDFYEKNRGKFRHGNRVRLSHLYIAIPKLEGTNESKLSAKDEASKETEIANKQKEKYKLAESYLEKARNGEDFAALADQYSEDPDKKKNDGGDLGFQDETKLTPDFYTKVAKLSKGSVVPDLVLSSHGYHIFKVTDREAPGFYRLAEVKDQLKNILIQQKGKETLNTWLNQQRQKAQIVISPELQNLLASNKLEKRESEGIAEHRRSASEMSNKG
jgi:parvulin-like peptidyl-prolyl isomerase